MTGRDAAEFVATLPTKVGVTQNRCTAVGTGNGLRQGGKTGFALGCVAGIGVVAVGAVDGRAGHGRWRAVEGQAVGERSAPAA